MRHSEDPGKWIRPYARHPRTGEFWWSCNYCGWKGEKNFLLNLECSSAPHSFFVEEPLILCDPDIANKEFSIVRKVS